MKNYELPIYLTGVSNEPTRVAASSDLAGKLGLLMAPRNVVSYSSQLISYDWWAMDNGCFNTSNEFDGDEYLRTLDRLANYVVGDCYAAHERCLFATAPDVVGDARATLDRSATYLSKIRETGLPVALVAQNGLEDMSSEIPWDEFDVLFLGGDDNFKLGYPDKIVAGNPHFKTDPFVEGAASEKTRAWARMIAEAHKRGKDIHVGRSNSFIRLTFAYEIGAHTADGTFLKFGKRGPNPENLDRLRQWYETLEERTRFDLPKAPTVPGFLPYYGLN